MDVPPAPSPMLVGSPARPIVRHAGLIVHPGLTKSLRESIRLFPFLVWGIVKYKYPCAYDHQQELIGHHTKPHHEKKSPEIEWILHIGIRSRRGDILIFLQVACCPNSQPFPRHHQQQTQGKKV